MRTSRDSPRMRVIGMLGGMSSESSAQYYRLANELTREQLGGLHSARLVLVSVDLLRSNSSRSPAVGAGRRTARRGCQVGRGRRCRAAVTVHEHHAQGR